jgi:hypothetical protein
MSELEGNQLSFNTCKKIQLLIGMDANKLFKHSYLKYAEIPSEFAKITFLRTHIKYCPECLLEGRYHRLLWGLNLTTICIVHSKVLINKCNCCKKRIKMKFLFDATCKYCGHNLCNADTRLILKESDLYKSQDYFQKIIQGNIALLNSKVCLKELMELIRLALFLLEGFMSFVEPFSEKIVTSMSKGGYYENFRFGVALANAFWVYDNFPNNFYSLLSYINENDYLNKKRKKNKLRSFLNDNIRFAMMKKAYIQYTENKITMGIVPRNIAAFDLEISKRVKKTYLTKKDIYSNCEITKNEVDKLCRNNVLRPIVINKGKQNDFLFCKDHVEEALKQFKKEQDILINKKNAATILGIRVEGINSLIEYGIINLYPSVLNKNILLLNRNDVFLLLTKINQSKKQIIHLDGNLLNLKRCFQKYATSGISLGKLMSLNEKNKLSIFGFNQIESFHEIYFDENQIKEIYKEESIKASGFCLGDVSRLLGFGERTLHKMIDAGIIYPNNIVKTKKGRKTFYFDVDYIQEFSKKYISVEEATKKYNLNESTIRTWIFNNKIINHLDGVCRRTLLKEEEIIKMLKKTVHNKKMI